MECSLPGTVDGVETGLRETTGGRPSVSSGLGQTVRGHRGPPRLRPYRRDGSYPTVHTDPRSEVLSSLLDEPSPVVGNGIQDPPVLQDKRGISGLSFSSLKSTGSTVDPRRRVRRKESSLLSLVRFQYCARCLLDLNSTTSVGPSSTLKRRRLRKDVELNGHQGTQVPPVVLVPGGSLSLLLLTLFSKRVEHRLSMETGGERGREGSIGFYLPS